jgi:poly(A) polymerase
MRKSGRRTISVEQAALNVVRRLREHGHEALWAGGCVRDMLLGQRPADIDVATDAPPERIIELFTHSRKVGAKFGVVMVKQGRHWIETATFRSDLSYSDGRHPQQVVFTNAEEDAQRRDFTINGLFYDPLAEEVIDYVGGRDDLEAGILRAIGDPDRRFEEDHLRMLRAVRFAARLNFNIQADTLEAIRRHAERIQQISAERIREELEKMFAHSSRCLAVRLLSETRLLNYLWPRAQWTQNQLSMATTAIENLPRDSDFVLTMAALLHDRELRYVQAVGNSIRCSNKQMDDIGWLVEHYPSLDRAEHLSLAEFKKLMAHDRFRDLLELHRAICQAEERTVEPNDRARKRSEAIPKERVAPPPLVTGEDLIREGVQPGPIFKEILDQLYDEQLNEKLQDRDEALKQLKDLLSR